MSWPLCCLSGDDFSLLSGLLSEEQCKARDVRRKAKTTRSVRKSDSMEGSPMSDKSSDTFVEDSKANVKLKANFKPETIVEGEPISKVSEDTKKLIEKCVFLQDKYEFPDEQIIQTVNVSIFVSRVGVIIGSVEQIFLNVKL